MIIVLLLLVGFTTWLFVKSFSTMFLLGRYNNRNGAKAGMHSVKARNPKQVLAMIRNAKAWDAESKAVYKQDKYRNF